MTKTIETLKDVEVEEFLVSSNIDKYLSGTVTEKRERSIIMEIKGQPPQEVPEEDLHIFARMWV